MITGTAEQVHKVAVALITAQSQMRDAPHDSKNPHFKSTYASLSSVIASVKAILAANGFAYTQGFEPGLEHRVCVVTTLLHTSGGMVTSRLEIAALKQDPQAYGAAITYGRRYALAAICGISTEEDTDGFTRPSPTVTPPAPNHQPQQRTDSATGGSSAPSSVPPLLKYKQEVWGRLVQQTGEAGRARSVLGTILPGRTSMEHFGQHKADLVALVLDAAVICDTEAVAQMTKAKLAQLIKSQLPFEQWTPNHITAARAAIRGAPVAPPEQPMLTHPAPGHSAHGDVPPPGF